MTLWYRTLEILLPFPLFVSVRSAAVEIVLELTALLVFVRAIEFVAYPKCDVNGVPDGESTSPVWTDWVSTSSPTSHPLGRSAISIEGIKSPRSP